MRKKLIQINTVCNTSTGRIMHDIQKAASEEGFETLSFVGRRAPYSDLPCVKFGNPISFWLHVALNSVFDRQGYGSFLVTRRMVKRLREEKPDIIHLHNLHGYYLNLPVLFRYLKEEFKGEIYWTFHDCWPFTGHCAYFTMAGCDKWKTVCGECPCRKRYPVSLLSDASTKNFRDKQKLFTGFENLTILTPSVWMEEQIKESFLKDYPVRVIPNGIDLKRFSYQPDDTVYEKYGIPENKHLLLGVADVWDTRKGFYDFLTLAKTLPEEYRIILVGLSGVQMKGLPSNIIGIKRTENQDELVKLYSAADLFVNPSLEESFSMVTVEALACGTPVIALNTSAVKELVREGNGIVLSGHETEDYLAAIREVENLRLTRQQVADTALPYEKSRVLKQIVALYKEKA